MAVRVTVAAWVAVAAMVRVVAVTAAAMAAGAVAAAALGGVEALRVVGAVVVSRVDTAAVLGGVGWRRRRGRLCRWRRLQEDCICVAATARRTIARPRAARIIKARVLGTWSTVSIVTEALAAVLERKECPSAASGVARGMVKARAYVYFQISV